VRVVVHATLSIHTLNKPGTAQRLPVVLGQVFRSAIAVEDRPAVPWSRSQGFVQGPSSQRGCTVAPIGPPQNATGVAIHHYRKVTPLAGHFQVSDIAHPDLIRSSNFLAMQLIVDAAIEQRVATTARVHLSGTTHDPVFSHQTLDSTAADGVAVTAQTVEHARAAVSASTFSMSTLDQRQPEVIFALSTTRHPVSPAVVARARYPKGAAHRRDVHGVFFGVGGVDGGKGVCFRLAFHAMNFFKASCSSCSILYLRLILRSSLSSA